MNECEGRTFYGPPCRVVSILRVICALPSVLFSGHIISSVISVVTF